jgi:hypothetical protein
MKEIIHQKRLAPWPECRYIYPFNAEWLSFFSSVVFITHALGLGSGCPVAAGTVPGVKGAEVFNRNGKEGKWVI